MNNNDKITELIQFYEVIKHVNDFITEKKIDPKLRDVIINKIYTRNFISTMKLHPSQMLFAKEHMKEILDDLDIIKIQEEL